MESASASARSVRVAGVALAVAAVVGTSLLGEAAASTKSTLQIAGRVPLRAGVWLSQTTLLFSSPGRMRIGNERVRLTDLGISANNKQFTVSLVSLNAANLGAPGLVDADTGAVIPYRLTLGGDDLSFTDGEARVAAGDEAGAGAKPLEIDMLADARPASGRYEERLLVVIAAR